MSLTPRRARPLLASLPLAALLMMGSLAAAPPAGKKALSAQELQSMAARSGDPATARETADRLKDFLTAPADSSFVTYARVVLVQALIAARAPIDEFVAEVKRTIPMLPARPEAKASFYTTVASHLADRGEQLPLAVEYAGQAIKLCPKEARYQGLLSVSRTALGYAQLQSGQTAAAIAALRLALPDSPDSQDVLLRLGQAYDKAGQPDAAIDAYVRSLGVFGSDDSTAAAPLRAAYLKRTGSLTGLDQKLEAARSASRTRVALDARRLEAPAPDWSLPDLDGRKVEWASLKGKVVVLDFWGSWCGPCRMELPYFQSLYERYRDRKDVAVLGMNWERAETTDEHVRAARDYMKKNNFSFPVVYDHEQIAVKSFQIEGFPTVFLIDRTGRIRYRNVGFDPRIDAILEAQIRSLLD